MNRPPALLVGAAPGLDFLNSIATPVDTPVDWLDDGEGYLSWLEQAHLVPRDILRDMRARAATGELDKVAEQARGLREWFRDFVARHKGRALTAEALVELGRSTACSSATKPLAASSFLRRAQGASNAKPGVAGATSTRCCSPSPRRWPISSARRTFAREVL